MVESAIKAVEGSGQSPVLSVRAQQSAEARAARDEREAEPVQKPESHARENEFKPAGVSLATHISTRVTLDSKTLQVYIQTVSDQPRTPVIHSYPPPPESIDPNRLIVLA